MLAVQVYSQNNPETSYQNLETKKFYLVSLSSETRDEISTYKVNNKKVSEATYNKYRKEWENIMDCCPCILQYFDIKENLIYESVACSECEVGWFKEYYKNGKIKSIKLYKENPTNNWENIFERGLCSVPNGQWVYLNKRGDTIYSEYWDNGEFVNQIPEQKKTEIWDIELLLNGQTIDTQKIELNEIKNLVIIPKYKNDNTNAKLKITFSVSAIGHRRNEKDFTIDTFKYIDIASMLDEVGIPEDKKTTYTLGVFYKKKFFKRFHLNVIR